MFALTNTFISIRDLIITNLLFIIISLYIIILIYYKKIENYLV
jgi:hypothetical protein